MTEQTQQQRPQGTPQALKDTQQPRGPVQALAKAISDRMPAFQAVATKYLTSERLVKLAQVVVAKNPALAECSTLSVLDCLMTCARLGLEPNEPGGVWLVPFKGVCTPIIDYRGGIDVCRRSGQIAAVHADIRYEKDEWLYAIDTTGNNLVNLRHKPAEGDRGKLLGAYFVAKLDTGQCQAAYLTEQQIDQFRARSRADRSGFSPWKTDWNAMAMKTAVRRGINLLPRTPETQALREELTKEDETDLLPIGDLTEGSQEAIERMLAEIGTDDKALADTIVAGFQALKYMPARQLQLLTRHHGDPNGLATWLDNEQKRRDSDAAKPAGSGQSAGISDLRTNGSTTEIQQESMPQVRTPKASKAKDAKASKMKKARKTATPKPATTETTAPKTETKSSEPETEPAAKPETKKPTLPPGASF